MDNTTLTYIFFTFISLFLFYLIYKLLQYQNKNIKFREGLENSNNCSISDFKDKTSKALEVTKGMIDITKKDDLEEIITNLYDIANYKILSSICSTDVSSDTVNANVVALMQYSQGLQKVMSWLDSK